MPMTLLIEVGPRTSTPAIDATLEWAATHRHRLLAEILVVMRGLNLEAAAAIDAARERAVPVDVLRLPRLDDHTPLDPNGQLTDHIRGDVVLWLEAGVVPDSVDAVTASAVELHKPGRREIAAVGGRVVPGPDTPRHGPAEPEAFPGVFMRGGVLLRWAAVRDVGGVSRLLVPGEAAWADLAWRIRRAGRRILRSDAFTLTRAHGEAAWYTGSDAARLRDSLIVVQRHLPRRFRTVYRAELLQAARLQAALHPDAGSPESGPLPAPGDTQFHADITPLDALAEARRWAGWERVRGPRHLSDAALERVFNRSQLRREVAAWSGRHPRVRRVALAGLNWHSHATLRAAVRAGLEPVAVVLPGLTPEAAEAASAVGYRGLPVRGLATLADAGSEVQGVLAVGRTQESAERLRRRIARHFRGPVFNAAAGRLSRAHLGTPTPVVTTTDVWPTPRREKTAA